MTKQSIYSLSSSKNHLQFCSTVAQCKKWKINNGKCNVCDPFNTVQIQRRPRLIKTSTNVLCFGLKHLSKVKILRHFTKFTIFLCVVCITLFPNWRKVARLILEIKQSGRQILEKNICCRREVI